MLSRIAATAAFALLLAQAQPVRRNLTPNDFDSWRYIASQQISNDGAWIAYSVFPQVGNGEVVLRNIQTGKEKRIPAGALPIREVNDPNAEPSELGPQPVRGPVLQFTADGNFLLFQPFPLKAEIDAAKKAKKPADESPKNGIVIVTTATGAIFTSGQVKSFQLAETNPKIAVYQKDTKEKSLVVRDLPTGQERTFEETAEYALTKDGQTLVYTVDAKKDEANGVYTVDPASTMAPVPLTTGKGKYAKLTWDDSQKLLAFAFEQAADSKLYGWTRGDAKATEWVTPSTEGWRPRWHVHLKGAVDFSHDGKHVFFGTAPPSRAPRKQADLDPDRTQFDLWHWKDDRIQTIQKVRANQDRDRSYKAVYHIETKKFVQLADLSMQLATPNDQGDFAFGNDDRQYRTSAEWDENASDIYFLDTATGQRSLISRKQRGTLNWSKDGRRAVFFDGRDWNVVNVNDTTVVKLTANTGVRFDNEENDSPRQAQPYGLAGWSKDSEWVLVYDQYDVWQLAANGSISRMVTSGLGRRKKIQFRYSPLSESPRNRTIDQDSPLILRGENLETYDSGFWTASMDFDAQPKQLLWGSKNYRTVLKAKDTDKIVFTAQSFTETPDLHIADSTFSAPQPLSTLSKQVQAFNWGSDEIMTFRNTDGVALKAALFKPAGFDPAKKYPMIVYIYERRSQELNNFPTPRPTNSINPAFYTSQGYVVLQPDIIYKVGYPGQSALNCVMPAVDAAVRLGYIDEKNVGIQGHSWGGYQIAYMVTRTNRFKAAEAGAVVANMTSAYGGIRYGTGLPRQFQYERTQSRIGGSLWDYPMRFLENSPLFAADRVETPLLMMHNDADDAVPWTQGIEFYLALRRNGKETYLFNYNGEPHNLRRRANQKDFTIRMKQFFDYYLMSAPKPDWMERGIPYLERN